MVLIKSVLLDTISDSIAMLPILFATFIILECLEQYAGTLVTRILPKLKRAGPLAGALFGCIPQCGFSIMASNLYAGRFLSVGTLLSVFLSTSDEALLILLSNPGKGRDIFFLLTSKIIIAIVAGYTIDLFFPRLFPAQKANSPIPLYSGIHEHNGFLKPVISHTVQLFTYVFVFSGILNLLIALFGMESISAFLLNDSIFQPMLAAVIGFIPNCATSVILTELYLQNAISFASVISGLCTNAGLGLVILFKANKNKRENFKIAGLLYLIAVISGMLLSGVSI